VRKINHLLRALPTKAPTIKTHYEQKAYPRFHILLMRNHKSSKHQTRRRKRTKKLSPRPPQSHHPTKL